MTADETKPRFEPPPWEREAFERFEEERRRERAEKELEEQLRRVRSPEEAEPDAEQEAAPVSPAEEIVQAAKADADGGQVPQAKVDSMLVQLRLEEKPLPKASPLLVNATTAAMVIAGFAIMVQSAVMFGRAYSAQGGEPALNMLAALMSFVVFMVGVAFVWMAALLFRKYHR